MRNLIIVLFVLLHQICVAFEDGKEKSGSRVGFFVSADGGKTYLKIFSFFVLPGEKLPIAISGSDNVEVKSDKGEMESMEAGKWVFTAPGKKGLCRLTVTDTNSGDEMHLNIFVMEPFSKLKNGYLNGYRIGDYPKKKYKDYHNPKGFTEVTDDNKDVFITPHFKLKQFLCKEPGDWPKYVVIRPSMLCKLELMLDKLNEEGVNAKTFFLMSAYRTPYYNKSIGNVKYSRHVFGDAIDLYVDDNHDGRMDDLNKDGRINIKDARVIASVVEKIEKDPKYREFIGGLGVYNKTSRHTYFVHVDTRGYRARW